MAIAPVLERISSVDEKEFVYNVPLTKDEVHNSRISDNYAKLINPETHIDEMLGRSAELEKPVTVEAEKSTASAPAASAYRAPAFAKVELVESARTSSDIFRADSAINAKPVSVNATVNTKMVSGAVDEEEDEDLRPTQTTIQYKTSAVLSSSEEGKITNYGADRRFTFTKKQKITVAVIVSVIVALFTLIIVNSIIISGINGDISSLDASLSSVKASYAYVEEQLDNAKENIDIAVENYAKENNMVKVAE